jgi:hypothetical protein
MPRFDGVAEHDAHARVVAVTGVRGKPRAMKIGNSACSLAFSGFNEG